jgi:hypothetical protein
LSLAISSYACFVNERIPAARSATSNRLTVAVGVAPSRVLVNITTVD